MTTAGVWEAMLTGSLRLALPGVRRCYATASGGHLENRIDAVVVGGLGVEIR